jgi:uncharacterized protein (DUF427 family)
VPHFPPAIVAVNHVAPAPRRVRGILGGEIIFDTDSAIYVWEWLHFPQYYIPRADVKMDALVPDGDPISTPQGEAQRHRLRNGEAGHGAAARLIIASAQTELIDRVRFEWNELDAWLEEDEEVFVHPRSPYVRVDALRSRRPVRVERDGVVLAESPAPVLVFETGLPTRYYLDARDVRFEQLVPSATRTACPYKGRTTGYWSVAVNGKTVPDCAWMYTFPTSALAPIAGLVAFLNERVDIFVDGVHQERPHTHMSA